MKSLLLIVISLVIVFSIPLLVRIGNHTIQKKPAIEPIIHGGGDLKIIGHSVSGSFTHPELGTDEAISIDLIGDKYFTLHFSDSALSIPINRKAYGLMDSIYMAEELAIEGYYDDSTTWADFFKERFHKSISTYSAHKMEFNFNMRLKIMHPEKTDLYYPDDYFFYDERDSAAYRCSHYVRKQFPTILCIDDFPTLQKAIDSCLKLPCAYIDLGDQTVIKDITIDDWKSRNTFDPALEPPCESAVYIGDIVRCNSFNMHLSGVMVEGAKVGLKVIK